MKETSTLNHDIRKGDMVPILFVTLVLQWTSFLLAEPAAKVDFGRDVRPILSNHCFQCHGSDEGTREASLRLDLREVAIESGAINLEHPGQSELLIRIHSVDNDQRMPPADANKPLSQPQLQTLKIWIEQGADYGAHWAFTRVETPTVPDLREGTWSNNEIDAFVLQKLNAQGLTPSPEADRETLIRRLSQDLLGLLPSLEEVDEFVQDESPDAYQKLVDRLLASPHYGERWGRHWLDQARYADSNGYTIDGPRIMWPYRDWVIAALNQDMPFDQFTVEQIAGDLLPNPTKSQLVATAFHRNTMINQEGGVKADQFRNEALIDRTNTTGAVWLGLTLGCAQCHSHKFDPISHNEYYGMYAFFNDAVDANNVGPTADVYQSEMFGWTTEQHSQLAELQQLRTEVAELEKQSKSMENLDQFPWNWLTPPVVGHRTKSGVPLALLPDGTLLAKEKLANNESFEVELQLPAAMTLPPSRLTALRLRVLNDPALPMNGPGTAGNGNFVLSKFSVHSGTTQFPLEQAWADHSQPGFPIVHVLDDDPKTGWAINVNDTQSKAGKKMNAPHEAILTLLKPVELEGQVIRVTLQHDVNPNYHVGRFVIDYSITETPESSEIAEQHTQLVEAKARLRTLENAIPGKGIPVKQMVIQRGAITPETYRLLRGDFLTPDQEQGPLPLTIPAALVTTASPPELHNRLDLAKWLVSRDNPLTARVTVNRVWSKYFGRGLVETENDFGFQGSSPTHPELLDWLSITFMERGWSLKELHRLILNSATYKQSSSFTPELRQRDPGNYLLARQSRFRVEAEIVRDQSLTASGLLTPTVGGPSVHPPQPDGIYNFTQNKKSWPTETGPDRFRRTLYTMFYRSAPYPLLSTFDAPDFSTTCTQRVRSNTPLQSLTMANDVVFRECAEGLANRVLQEEALTTTPMRLQQMFRMTLTRNPHPAELDVLAQFFNRELERFQATPTAAKEFVATQLEGSDLPQLAALTSLARVLLNIDEFMTRN